jgi:hypothetical protein
MGEVLWHISLSFIGSISYAYYFFSHQLFCTYSWITITLWKGFQAHQVFSSKKKKFIVKTVFFLLILNIFHSLFYDQACKKCLGLFKLARYFLSVFAYISINVSLIVITFNSVLCFHKIISSFVISISFYEESNKNLIRLFPFFVVSILSLLYK